MKLVPLLIFFLSISLIALDDKAAKKIEDVDHYKKSRMLDVVNSLSNEKRNFSYLLNKKLINYHKIGYHTINHYNLSKLSYDNQKIEIELGKKELESIINQQVKIFAYPFGNRYHYNADTLEIVKRNFNFAFSNFVFSVLSNNVSSILIFNPPIKSLSTEKLKSISFFVASFNCLIRFD